MFSPPFHKDWPSAKPTPELSEHIKQRNWTAARLRLLAFPFDAKYRPSRGNQVTPLHLCCTYRAPIDVITLLVDANPGAILAQDSAGWTPIHVIILQGGQEDVAILLIRRGGVLGASLQSPLAGSPLDLACRHGVSDKILKELVHSNALMAIVANQHGIKPCQSIWYHFEKDPANQQVLGVLNETGDETTTCSRKRAREEISSSPAAENLLCRLHLVIEGIKQDSGLEASPLLQSSTIFPSSLIWDIVERQSQLGDLTNFLEIAVLKYPEQLQLKDTITGNFVLHVAASNPRLPKLSRSYNWRYQSASIGDSNRDSICILVETYPEAAGVRNFMSDFPLYLALFEGRRTWNTGVASLVQASVEPLHYRERRTKLFPFQLAAMTVSTPNGQSEEESLETIFQLLLACPHVLSCSC